jgi:hypothetical protein
MFLVSCNPDYQQIRHLVITGFAELGRYTKEPKPEEMDIEFQRIKETSIVGIHSHLSSDPKRNV